MQFFYLICAQLYIRPNILFAAIENYDQPHNQHLILELNLVIEEVTKIFTSKKLWFKKSGI